MRSAAGRLPIVAVAEPRRRSAIEPPLRSRAVRWTAVVNPERRTRVARAPAPRAASRASAARASRCTSPTDASHLAPPIAREAFARGDGVVACGGDGTVALLAGVGRRDRRVLAVVPTGAGNDFASAPRHRPPHPLARRRSTSSRTARVATVDLAQAHRRRRHESVVHDGRQHRVRRRREPLGERRAPHHRHAALRRSRRCARSRSTGRSRSSCASTTRSGRVPSGSSRSATPAATPAG